MGGILDIALMMDPDREWDPANGDHHTDLSIDAVEWEHLFLDTIGAPIWEEFVQGEDIGEYDDRQRHLFQKDLSNKGLPMLGRIWRIYRDTKFYPFEIGALLTECTKLEPTVSDPDARAALQKLIISSRKALLQNSGLLLISD